MITRCNMETREILKCFHQDGQMKQYAIGVVPADKLPIPHKRPCCFIANTDPSNKSGRHWLAIYVGADGIGELFNSYGKPPGDGFEKYMKKHCKHVTYNSVRVQGPLSSSCGQFCIFYLSHRVRGRSMNNIISDFSVNLTENDICVVDFVNKQFNLNEKAFEFDFIVSQFSKSE